ncbi:MAG: alpha/beta hydrolase [Bacteroidales bacterium]|jgi:alpha-beta hydrolase superfamily lysophospholipase|nr:alpha/beta hydrolase [Bacteroidales bacterium]
MDYQSTTYASFDGIKLSGYLWKPETKPSAVINLVHGFGEYSERYNHWAKLFVKNGYAVHAIDYRGHGMSDGKRGYIHSFEDYLNDIDVLVRESAKLFPETPPFIYGHSLGGNIVTNYILKRENRLRGAVISSPWFKLAFDPSAITLWLAKTVKNIFPKFTQKANLDVQGISHDQRVVDNYIKDPLVHEKISVRMFFEIYRAGNWALENPQRLNIPVLIQHGNADKITSFHASKEFADHGKTLTKDIAFKEWKGMYHELHNELKYEEVFKFVVEWLENKL